MGGFGSGGRTFRRRTVENTFQLNIARLKEWGSLKPGAVGRLTWSMGDREAASLGYATHDDHIVLKFRYSENGSTNWQSIERRIDFISTPCHFGGSRKWFECPGCTSRMGTLCLHQNRFLCRHCLGLPYRSQNSSDYDRAIQKLHKLRARVTCLARIGSEIHKPKGMHWKTFLRLQQRYDEAETAANQGQYSRLTKLERKTQW